MPAVKKPEHLKISGAKIVVYVPISLKADVDAMAADTGVSNSQRVRDCMESAVKKWKSSKS